MAFDAIDTNVILARQMRALRVLLGWKQEDLARAAGVTRKTVSRAELGGRMHRATAAAIARALGVELPSLSEQRSEHAP